MMKNRLMQAYKLVPWRRQLQWIGLGSLAIVTTSLVAWLYLSISAKTGIAGREMQDFQSEKTKAEQSIASMETNLAEITSSVQMAKRAKALGFKEVSTDRNEYMMVPGYGGKPSAKLAPEIYTTKVESDVITTEFTQSLWDWAFTNYIEPAITP
jgi:hypothetical protein